MIKGKDSDNNGEEHIQHKHGEQWELIETEAINMRVSFTPSAI